MRPVQAVLLRPLTCTFVRRRVHQVVVCPSSDGDNRVENRVETRAHILPPATARTPRPGRPPRSSRRPGTLAWVLDRNLGGSRPSASRGWSLAGPLPPGQRQSEPPLEVAAPAAVAAGQLEVELVLAARRAQGLPVEVEPEVPLGGGCPPKLSHLPRRLSSGTALAHAMRRYTVIAVSRAVVHVVAPKRNVLRQSTGSASVGPLHGCDPPAGDGLHGRFVRGGPPTLRRLSAPPSPIDPKS